MAFPNVACENRPYQAEPLRRTVGAARLAKYGAENNALAARWEGRREPPGV